MSTSDTREIVVITGASAGVGRATALAFARRRARIALVARGVIGLEATRRDVEELGGEGLAIPTDVSDPAQVESAAERAEATLGPIDIWINNAMTTVFSEFKDITPEEFRRVTEVTYLGTVYGTMAALKRMLPRDRGTVVQVGSALADRSIPLQSAYCGAKHAVRGFTDSIRSELIHDRRQVHLTMVQLPAVNTPQFNWSRSHMPRRPQPVPPIFQPEIAAEGIYWAAHHTRRELEIGWPTVGAMWGNRFFRGYLDRRLGWKAYDGQMTDEREDPRRPDNLWRPVEGDFGAHGEFDERARDQAWEFWASRHRRAIGLAAAVLSVAALGLAWSRRR